MQIGKSWFYRSEVLPTIEPQPYFRKSGQIQKPLTQLRRTCDQHGIAEKKKNYSGKIVLYSHLYNIRILEMSTLSTLTNKGKQIKM